MAKTAHSFVTGLAFTVTLFTYGQAAASGNEPMVLVLHLENYARIPAANLARAESVVSAVYADAGVLIVWMNEDKVTVIADDGRRHLNVMLLCSEMTNAKVTAERVPDNVIGQAAPGSSRAYIYTFRVREVALKNNRNFDMMLGRVIAHEVGHLLLPPGSHARQGIMREHLDVQAFKSERFTTEQGDALRLALNR